MPMHNPPHPGLLVRHECLEPLGLSVERAAEGLGVSAKALSDLMDGKASVSVDMSIRLSKAFGSSPEVWVGMQIAYDQWQIRKGAKRMKVEDFNAEARMDADGGFDADGRRREETRRVLV